MAILGFEGSLIFVFLAVIYNVGMSVKLLFEAISDVKIDKERTKLQTLRSIFNPKENKLIWNLLSVIMMTTGSLLVFFWYFQSFSPIMGWNGLIGSLLIAINNIAATVLAFMNRIKATIFGKIINVLLSLLALATFFFFLNKVAAQTIFDLPNFLEWIILAPTVGYAMFQALLFSPSSYFFPGFILLPLCTPIKFLKEKEEVELGKTRPPSEEKKKVRDVFLDDLKEDEEAKPSTGVGIKKFLDNGTKGIFGLLIIFLLVFHLLGTGVMSSFGPYVSSKYQPALDQRNDFEFGVTLNTVTYHTTLPSDYETYFDNEIELLKELGATTVRLDVNHELLDENSTALKDITDELKSNGFKIMLATYGYSLPTWNFLNVSFATYTETIENQSLELIQLCEPEFLLIYPEPLTFAPYYLSEEVSLDKWVNTINITANNIHAFTNDTKVGVNLVINEDHPNFISNLFEPLWVNSSLDIIGLDLYPLREKYLNLDGYLEKMVNNSKEFWITEFGISAVTYGEKRQAGALARMLEICVNQEQIHGLVYFTLIDYSPGINTLGLVAESGHVRKAFDKYKEIIQYVTS